jgi:streptomycin 6-kinase
MMLPMALPRAESVEETAQAFIARHFGAEGRAWLTRLPATLAELAHRWQLEIGPPLRGGLLSAVHLVTTADGVSAVLKVGGPWSPTHDEAAALRIWKGGPTPALLRADVAACALLLERIEPGTSGANATGIDVTQVLRSLHVPAPDGLPGLSGLVRERLETAGRDGRQRHKLDWAFAKVAELERRPEPPVLLHGDFDERNLLWSRRGLTAIDPWPCEGDAAYDAAYWVHGNRRPGRRARLDAIVEATGLDRARVRDWAAVIGVHG